MIYTCPMHPEIEQDHAGHCPKCGMTLEPKTIGAGNEEEQKEIRSLSRKFWSALVLTIPVLFIAMGHAIPGLDVDAMISKQISKWIEFALTTPVVLWAGDFFFTRAWRSIVNRSLNMFTLIAVGVGAAYFYSAVAVLAPGIFPESFRSNGEVGLYFEAAAVITTLVLFGQLIEAKVNQTVSFLVRAEKIGSETLLSQIVQMVADAQRTRAPIQKLADAVSGYFVPAVIAIAVITFVIWSIVGPAPAMAYALVNAVSVLIIACPCALGLAAPMSIIVGVGRAAQAGILVKNAQAIEVTERVTHLVTDKTGTLTAGKPEVVSRIAANTISERDLLQIAASVEAQSEHPLARAIVEAAEKEKIALRNVIDFQSTTGGGVSGNLDGKAILIGKEKFLAESNVKFPEELTKKAHRLQQKAETTVWLAINGDAAGVLGIADPIKPTTREAVSELHEAGLKITM